MEKYKTVDEFLNGLDHDRRFLVEELRKYIFEQAPSLVEHIKWNAPSYVKDGEDRITFNILNKEKVVKLVFHMGATKKEDKKREPVLKDANLIDWVSDIRGYMTFENANEVTSNKNEIKRIVGKWVELN